MTCTNDHKEYLLFSNMQSNNEDPRYYMDEVASPGKYDKWDTLICNRKRNCRFKCKFVGKDKEKLRIKTIRAARKSNRLEDTKYVIYQKDNPCKKYLSIGWTTGYFTYGEDYDEQIFET
jgi:hypothetical protein